jgi:CheY-like chemotaxis protein
MNTAKKMPEKRAVLVVDDNPQVMAVAVPQVRAVAVDMCEALGLIAFDAYHGELALQILAEHPEIEVLFADVKMPFMDGVSLARAARQIRPGLQIVLTSGYIEPDELPADADVFLPKPVRLNRLAAILA